MVKLIPAKCQRVAVYSNSFVWLQSTRSILQKQGTCIMSNRKPSCIARLHEYSRTGVLEWQWQRIPLNDDAPSTLHTTRLWVAPAPPRQLGRRMQRYIVKPLSRARRGRGDAVLCEYRNYITPDIQQNDVMGTLQIRMRQVLGSNVFAFELLVIKKN
jgi:hypothetical protein